MNRILDLINNDLKHITIFSIKFAIEASLTVERLHKIADVVDEQTKSI